MHAELCAPAAKLITNSSVNKREAQRPESHFQLFDSQVSSSKEDDIVVTKYTGRPTDKISNQGSEKDQSSENCRPVVRPLGDDFGDRVEADYARSAAKGEDDSGNHDVRESRIFCLLL